MKYTDNSQRVKINRVIAKTGIDKTLLAIRIGLTPRGFENKLKNYSFNETELKAIAKAVGCRYDTWSFCFDDETIK